MTATKGLEGIVATTSSISSIVDGVLTYRGFDIDDLAENATLKKPLICCGLAICLLRLSCRLCDVISAHLHRFRSRSLHK